MKNKLIEKLQTALSKRSLFGWQIFEVETKSHQSFLALGDRECFREANVLRYDITIHVLKEEGGTKKLGTSSFELSPESFPNLEKNLDEAIFAAGLVSNEIFELPDGTGSYPEVEILDASLSKDTLKECEDRTRSAVSKEKGIRLSSAEFFVDEIHSRLLNHKGLNISQESSILESEIILLASSGKDEKEFISRFRRRFIIDFNLEVEIERASQLSRDAGRSRLPKTGEFPVVFSGETLDKMFEPLIAWSSARLRYNRIIDKALGSNLVGAGKVAGDAITIWSNGLLKGGMGSCRFDGFGSPMSRVLLIQNNILKTYLANKQYADYLKIPVTGDLGNIEVAPGSTPFELFLDPSLIGEKVIYHIQAFSAFEPNPITGAFSAEIRAGYEIKPGSIQPIKGGSVSGFLQQGLQNCLLSKEQELRERILAPKGILFKKLTLAGA